MKVVWVLRRVKQEICLEPLANDANLIDCLMIGFVVLRDMPAYPLLLSLKKVINMKQTINVKNKNRQTCDLHSPWRPFVKKKTFNG